MFSVVLTGFILSSIPSNTDTLQNLSVHSSFVQERCKAGVPVRTRRLMVELEYLLTTACVPKTGPVGIIIVCTADICHATEDPELPSKDLEKFLRATERPGKGT